MSAFESLFPLNFVDRAQRKAKEPEKPKIDVEEIREHLVNAQHDSIQRLSADISVLKNYLKDEGIEPNVISELDTFCRELDEIWDATVQAIVEKIE